MLTNDLDGAVHHPEEEAEREEGDLGEECLDNVPPLLGQALGHPYLPAGEPLEYR
jgi:hypothetical protein